MLEASRITRTQVFYERRIGKRTVEDMSKSWPERNIVIAREVTKIHEEFLRGRVSEFCKR